MRTTKLRYIFTGLLVFLSFSVWTAGVGATGVGVRVSSLGFGVESSQSLHPKLNTRFGYNQFSIQEDGAEGDVDYSVDLGLKSVTALLDWHPFSGSFRLTGGLLVNSSSVDLSSRPSNLEYDIGNEKYTSSDLSVTGELGFRPIAPYLSVGFGVSPAKKQDWGITAEFGVVVMGEIDVNLNASGSATRVGDATGGSIDVGADAVFQENLAKEERALEQDIEDYVYFPVISLGFIYVF